MFIFGKRSKLKPELGFWQVLLMAFSGTLGGGLFVLLGKAAGIAGALLPLSFLIAGGIASLISRVYAELATSIPAAGGGQVYIRNAFGTHPLVFIVYWLNWLAQLAFTALTALGLGFYLSPLIPGSPLLIALIALAVVVGINLKGIKPVGKIEMGIGLGLLVCLLALLGLALNDFSWSAFSSGETAGSQAAGGWGWLAAVPLIFVVFIGNEDIASIAAEAKNKAQNIPKALGWSTLLLTGLTVALSFVLVHSFPLSQLEGNPRPFALFAKKFGFLGGLLSYFTVLLACVSSVFYSFLTSTRMAFSLGEAGELPKFFSKVSKRKIPIGSVLIAGFLTAMLCSFRNAGLMAYIASVGFFLQCILVSAVLLKLRKKRPHLPRPFLVKPFPLVPILVIGLSFLFLVLASSRAWLVTLGFAILGFLIYILRYFNKKRALTAIKGIGAFLGIIGLLFLLLYFLHLY